MPQVPGCDTVVQRLLESVDDASDSASSVSIDWRLIITIYAVFLGLALLFRIIDCIGVFHRFANQLNGRENSPMLAKMSEDEYRAFLVVRRRYAGNEPYRYALGACGMAPGGYEDFLRFVANQHKLGAIFLADARNPFSRSYRVLAFLIVNSFVFIMIAAAALAGSDASLLINIFAIAPARIVIDEMLYYLLAVPCTRFYCCAPLRCLVNCISHSTVLFMFLISLLLLFFASLVIKAGDYDSPADERGVLWNYLYSVFVVSNVQELFGIWLEFVNNRGTCCTWFSMFVSLASCGLIHMGSWEAERQAYLDPQPSMFKEQLQKAGRQLQTVVQPLMKDAAASAKSATELVTRIVSPPTLPPTAHANASAGAPPQGSNVPQVDEAKA